MKLSDEDYGTYGMNLPEDPDAPDEIDDLVARMMAKKGGKQLKKRKPRPNAKGIKCLYAHDFMLWLKENQDNYNG